MHPTDLEGSQKRKQPDGNDVLVGILFMGLFPFHIHSSRLVP